MWEVGAHRKVELSLSAHVPFTPLHPSTSVIRCLTSWNASGLVWAHIAWQSPLPQKCAILGLTLTSDLSGAIEEGGTFSGPGNWCTMTVDMLWHIPSKVPQAKREDCNGQSISVCISLQRPLHQDELHEGFPAIMLMPWRDRCIKCMNKCLLMKYEYIIFISKIRLCSSVKSLFLLFTSLRTCTSLPNSSKFVLQVHVFGSWRPKPQ